MGFAAPRQRAGRRIGRRRSGFRAARLDSQSAPSPTIGIPGTGLSHTTQRQLRPSTEDELEQVEAIKLEELNYLRGRAMRKLVGWGSALVIVLLIFSGAGTAGGYLIIPAVVLTIIAPWFARWI